MMKSRLNINKFVSIVLISFCIPLFTFAASTPGSANFYDFKSFVYFVVYSMFTPLMYVISGLIFLYFFWGVTKYIWHAGDMEKRKEGYRMLMHGVIAITVSMSIWGIIYFLFNSFGFYAPQGAYSSYPSPSTQGSVGSPDVFVPTNNPYDPSYYYYQ